MEITQEMIDFAEGQKWDEDIRQDVYVILLEKEEGYMGNVSVEQLVTSIYNLRSLNGHRQDKRRKELMQENAQAIEKFHSTEGVHDPLENSELDDLLKKIFTLSPLLYRTVNAVLVHGTDPATVANQEGVSVNTIYQRLHQAKKELQDG